MIKMLIRHASRNPYRILELPYDASEEMIKSAYFKLAKKYHPDVNSGSSVWTKKEMFKLVNEAYGQLKGRGKQNSRKENSYATPEPPDMLWSRKWEKFHMPEEKIVFTKAPSKPFKLVETFAIS